MSPEVWAWPEASLAAADWSEEAAWSEASLDESPEVAWSEAAWSEPSSDALESDAAAAAEPALICSVESARTMP